MRGTTSTAPIITGQAYWWNNPGCCLRARWEQNRCCCPGAVRLLLRARTAAAAALARRAVVAPVAWVVPHGCVCVCGTGAAGASFEQRHYDSRSTAPGGRPPPYGTASEFDQQQQSMLRGMRPACVSRRQGSGACEPSTNRNRRVTIRGETKGVQGTGFGHRTGAHWGGQQGGAAEAAGTARAVGTRCARAQPPHAPGAQISRRAFKYASPRHSLITLNKFTHTHRRSRGRHRRSSNQTTSSFFERTSAKTASQTRRPKAKMARNSIVLVLLALVCIAFVAPAGEKVWRSCKRALWIVAG